MKLKPVAYSVAPGCPILGEGKDSGQELMDRCATHSCNARNCASEECSGRFTAFMNYSLVNAQNEWMHESYFQGLKKALAKGV
jgi:hypothetical protein